MFTVNLESNVQSLAPRHLRLVDDRPRQSPGTLAEAVELAVDQVDPGCLKPVTRANAGVVFQPRTLLGLLTFYYARQVYGSIEIAAQLPGEMAPFWGSDSALPDAQALQRFRAANREILAFCLKSVLLYLAEEKIRQGIVTHVRRAHLAQEALRRIIMAMFTDSLEMPAENKTEFQLDQRFEVAGVRGRVH